MLFSSRGISVSNYDKRQAVVSCVLIQVSFLVMSQRQITVWS